MSLGELNSTIKDFTTQLKGILAGMNGTASIKYRPTSLAKNTASAAAGKSTEIDLENVQKVKIKNRSSEILYVDFLKNQFDTSIALIKDEEIEFECPTGGVFNQKIYLYWGQGAASAGSALVLTYTPQ